MSTLKNELEISCPAFSENGEISKKHTGFGEDTSPQISIKGLLGEIKTLAIIMDDLDVPFVKEYTHWIIWNIKPQSVIAENIPYGEECLNGVRQGLAYGKNRYRGPKQPPFIKKAHRYRFCIYALDCIVDLPSTAKKGDLLKAMDSHILQRGEITGWYKR